MLNSTVQLLLYNIGIFRLQIIWYWII